MKLSEEKYILYKNFLKVYRPFYNVFYLADLIHWMRNDQVFLSAEQIKEKWEEQVRLIKEGKNSDVLNFYIHIPFCRSKCSYCKYYSNPLVDDKLKSYLNRLIKQMFYFRQTFSGAEFSSLYIGGGTPSVLTLSQLDKLLSNLFNCFRFKEGGEKTFESNPESITLEKLKLLKKFRFNRVSFGVQSLDKMVLSYANRDYQNYNLIKKVVKNAKLLGLEVNTDIMIGLRGESIKSIINSFIDLTRVQPNTITLYLFKPSEEYLKKYFNNDYDSFNSQLYKKAKIVYRILKLKAKTLNYFKNKRSFEICNVADPIFRPKEYKAPYKNRYGYTAPFTYPKPCSLFALGTRASAYIFNSLQYHDAAIGSEIADFNPNEKNYWSLGFDLRDEMRYFILQQLSSRLCFSRKEFENYFGSCFEDNFKPAINSLKELKKIKFNKDLVFLPSDPIERYTCALFFLDEKKAIKKIKGFLFEKFFS